MSITPAHTQPYLPGTLQGASRTTVVRQRSVPGPAPAGVAGVVEARAVMGMAAAGAAGSVALASGVAMVGSGVGGPPNSDALAAVAVQAGC